MLSVKAALTWVVVQRYRATLCQGKYAHCVELVLVHAHERHLVVSVACPPTDEPRQHTPTAGRARQRVSVQTQVLRSDCVLRACHRQRVSTLQHTTSGIGREHSAPRTEAILRSASSETAHTGPLRKQAHTWRSCLSLECPLRASVLRGGMVLLLAVLTRTRFRSRHGRAAASNMRVCARVAALRRASAEVEFGHTVCATVALSHFLSLAM